MRDSLRTFCLRQLYKNPACSSKKLVELAVQHDYLEPSTGDPQTKLLSVLAGIPREERLNNDQFFPGGLGEFRAYDSLVTVLAQSRTLDTTLLRPLVGAVNLALHQDRRFYCLEDGSWYLQHQTIVNDELFSALKEEPAEVSLKKWLETFITKNPGTVPIFWSLDPRFVLEGEHVRLNAHCTPLGEELENLWPAWEAKFAHGARISTENLLQAFPQHDDCRPSILALEQVLALKGVYPIGHGLWIHSAFIPSVPSVGGAVAFRITDALKEEPLAFPSLLVLDSLGIGEVVLTAAHRIYGVLPISWNKVERLHPAKGLGLGLGLKPEDNTFEVWHQDGFLYSEALAQRLSLLGPGQRLRLSVTEEGLSFELRGFDARIAKTQNGLFSREELLLAHSALSASLLAQVQAASEGINLSALLANLGAEYSLSEITLALTSPLIERGAGGFCRYKTLSFDPQEAILTLFPKSSERQPPNLSTSQPILEEAEVPMTEGTFLLPEEQLSADEEDTLTALSQESPEPQSPEAWSEFQENVEPYITLTEAELLELIQEQVSASENTAPPVMHQSLDEPLTAQAPALDTPSLSAESIAHEDEKKTFSPLSLEELFSLQSEEDAPEDILSVKDLQVLEEESEEDLSELMNSLYEGPPGPPIHPSGRPKAVQGSFAKGGEAPLDSPQLMENLEDLEGEYVPAEATFTDVQPIASDLAEVQTLQSEQEDHAPALIHMGEEEGAIIEPVESIAEEEPILLEARPTPVDSPAVLELEEVDEALQIAPEIIEQSREPEERGVVLAEEKEDFSQPTISAELIAEGAEQVVVEIQAPETVELLQEEETVLLISDPMVSSFLLEDLVFDLAEEELLTPVESIAEVEVQAPIVLEIHPIADTPAISDVQEEVVLFVSEPAEQSWSLEGIIQDLTEAKDFALPIDSTEPIAEVEEPIAFEIQPIAVNDAEPVAAAHDSIQESLEPTPSLWIDELRMDLAEEEAPLERPTEMSYAATTASPEAIAFLNTLFEEERETEKDEEKTNQTNQPSESLQAKLDQLVAQREAILAQRLPSWTTLMQTVMAKTDLSPQQQEEFQGVWMGKQTVQSQSLYASVEPYLCQLTVLSRLPMTGPLDLFVQSLKEHVVLGEVDPTSVLESLILPVLQYQRTAEGWAQKSL